MPIRIWTQITQIIRKQHWKPSGTDDTTKIVLVTLIYIQGQIMVYTNNGLHKNLTEKSAKVSSKKKYMLIAY